MMHPYLTHLLEDIENAKKPGYSENHPFLSNYKPQENEESELDLKNDKNESDVAGLTPFSPPFDEDDLAEHFAEVERYVSEDPPNSFGYYCGLKVTDFPPAEQLTEDDMQIIIKAFEKMSYTWNIDFSFPETLPTHLHYKILINTLGEKTMLTESGFVSFDYCSGNPEGCKFGEYCSCLKYWQEDDSEKS